MKWLARDHGHHYHKRLPTVHQRAHPSFKRAGARFVYQCTQCQSWMAEPSFESTKMGRPVGFCVRSQGMLFDKPFRSVKQ